MWQRAMLFLIVALQGFCLLQAQETESSLWLSEIMDKVEQTDMSVEEAELIIQKLHLLIANPIDLNQALESDLRELPFLSDFQIRQFIAYIHRLPNGLSSIWDLKLIPGWDPHTLDLVRPFVIVVPKLQRQTFSGLLPQKGSSMLKIGFRQPLPVEDKQSDYLGSSSAWRFKAAHRIGNRLSAGLVGDLDPGEPFDIRRFGGFDHYSAHLMLSDFGKLRKLVLGDFRLSLGYGLVCNQSIGFLSSRSDRIGRGLVHSFSASENSYQRGIAISLGSKQLFLTLAASRTGLDAREELHSDGKKIIQSFKYSGLHRNKVELDTRHNVNMRSFIGNLHYADTQVECGFLTNIYDWGGSALLRPPGRNRPEKWKNPTLLANSSFYYRYSPGSGRLSVYGEAALDRFGSVAFLQAMSYIAANNGQYSCLLRHFGKEYWAYFGRSSTHFTGIGNEQGLLLSMAEEIGRFRVFSEIDLYRTLVPRYRRKENSSGYRLRLELSPVKSSVFNTKFRASFLRERKGQSNLGLSSVFVYNPEGENWNACLEGRYLHGSKKIEREQVRYKHSYAVGIRANCSFFDNSLRFCLGGILFHSEVGRLFFSERQIELMPQFTGVHGKGGRCYLWGELRIGRAFRLQLKAEHNRVRQTPTDTKAQSAITLSLSYTRNSVL
ncbi:helix-hairpin-helix domain-containing protein [Porphyromonas crevioricanis]|nr:hypothetical protein [Porphyromonas crevioricanis]